MSDSSFQVLGRPFAKVSSMAAWDRAINVKRTTFDYIGPYDQAIIVPTGQVSLVLDLAGSSSSLNTTYAGRGASAKVNISGLVSGSMLWARVGGMAPSYNNGGWPGGGMGGVGWLSYGTGGGGCTIIMKPPFSFPGDVILVVPGGGGEAYSEVGTGKGGDADMYFADDGGLGGNQWAPAYPPTTGNGNRGHGATSTANGGANEYGGPTSAGADYQGGVGNGVNIPGWGGCAAGGGGSGAKAGGGGAATFQIWGYASGGGGGAGFVSGAAGVSVVNYVKGGNLGHGQIVVAAEPSRFPPTPNSHVYNFTGAQQTFLVPSGVHSIVAELKGAQGANVLTSLGGKGGYLRFRMPVTPGEIIYVYVGGQGNTFNGGGFSRSGRGGGGATDVRRGGNAVANRVGVAGGGGGCGGGYDSTPGSAAGFLTGLGAYFNNNSGQYARATWTTGTGNEIGGEGGHSSYTPGFDGGGGGGGYRGGVGGDGSGSSNTGGGGGGATGWVSSVCTELDYQDGFVTGNGTCVIRW
jgi:hypothetical protein